MSSLTDLHKEKLVISQKIEDNDKAITELRRKNYWYSQHLKLLEKEIAERKEGEQPVSELLDEISKGIK